MVVLMGKAVKILIGVAAVGIFLMLLKREIGKPGRPIDTKALKKDFEEFSLGKR